MKFIIAPQGFKGSITGSEAARAIQRGVKAADSDAQTVLLPVADGGDGTLHALVDATGGKFFESKVQGPLGLPIEASWGVMGDGVTAVIEMARPSGLALLPPERRDPRITTTWGTGEIMKEALEKGFRRIIVGLGGSASNDGGAGMAGALGARFLDVQGRDLALGGAALANLNSIDLSGLHPGLADAVVIGATDVTNPLCGPTGASAVYGPQKGASAEMVDQLDAALGNFAAVVERAVGKDVREHPRCGAAGGLGAGLIAFTRGELRSGIDMVCEVLGFDDHLAEADLVITGEGRADRSTIFDKAPVGVARRAIAKGVPTVLLAGGLGPGYQELYQHGIAGIVTISDRPMNFPQSLRRTQELLEGAAERTIRLMKVWV